MSQTHTDTHCGVNTGMVHTITCLINPNATTPISPRAPGKSRESGDGRRQVGAGRGVHGASNDDELIDVCKWRRTHVGNADNNRNMRRTAAGSPFPPTAENMNGWCVSGLLIPGRQRQWTHHWARYGSLITNHMARSLRPPVSPHHLEPEHWAGTHRSA